MSGHRPLTNLLYEPWMEHDCCGVGFVADSSGARSHRILQMALSCVENVTHRGAVAADAGTGDGAGVLTQIPFQLFEREVERLGQYIHDPSDLAVGMFFLPRNPARLMRSLEIAEEAVKEYQLDFLGWREVPVDPSALGKQAAQSQPEIRQALLSRPALMSEDAFERRLYLIRKSIEKHAAAEGLSDLYVSSLSNKTIVYKGLMVASQLPGFYPDLQDSGFETAIAMFHQRYSTNTFPSWELAQPFRYLGHNGEINTIQGNRNWMSSREPELRSPVWRETVEEMRPLVSQVGSDSLSLDNALEVLKVSGRDLTHGVMMLIPEAWENMPHMPAEARAFYRYHSCLCEPWDGPAAVTFSDGVTVGAILDRNGLRPARYTITTDGVVVMGSETGLVGIDESRVLRKGQLNPGEIIAVDTAKGEILPDLDAKRPYFGRRPYGRWVKQHMVELKDYVKPCPNRGTEESADANLPLQKAFGYTAEEMSYVLKEMGIEGKEPTGSMGDDTPLAVLSDQPRLVYDYFKQRFSQVTNPPIDPVREKVVMSLSRYLGVRHSLLQETEHHARQVHLATPILRTEELHAMRGLNEPDLQPQTIHCLFDSAGGPGELRRALDSLCDSAVAAVQSGKTILILSDRGVGPLLAPVPMLLAVSAVHNHLIRKGCRMRASLVVDSGEPREVHHFAVLTGCGASSVHPYLALSAVVDLAEKAKGELSSEEAVHAFIRVVEKGLLKVMSKLGISCLSSYFGARNFEAIGLGGEVMDRCFPETPSHLGGVGFDDLAEEVLARHREAFQDKKQPKLKQGGTYRYRKHAEYHAFNPDVVKGLHQAVRDKDHASYLQFAELVNRRTPIGPRDLLRFREAGEADRVPLEEVEPVEEIWKRFGTAGMSLGALSPEAHETLAIAMNRIGGRSNSGEGGEDPDRFGARENGDWPNSRVKQVASARFGVTPAYLASADEIQIKMAQGSKPGEGGQLPGHKVDTHIAAIRHSVPGVTLISPPPHHDIYSIEDLAQLIYDLKQSNPRALVNVKLVSEAGVGTIAAGVVKAYADVVHISGHDGGTGASPWTSIKNAGSPWELGLAETQQVLVMNGLRGRVRLRVDGGLKTGRDVVTAALLGAEGYDFGTAPLVAQGCIMARQCHLNTCPVGIATQNRGLRAKFTGSPEDVITYLRGVAEEVRTLLGTLGFRSLDEAIGRSDLFEFSPPEGNPKLAKLDFSRFLADPDPEGRFDRKCAADRNDRPGASFDDGILGECRAAFEGQAIEIERQVRNVDRAIGTRISGELAKNFGNQGIEDILIKLNFNGSAGQSLGAFLSKGVEIHVEGEANDYVGKGMAGGLISLHPHEASKYPSQDSSIIGNAVLYGATGGQLFAAGRAGERFAVRNSGADAVVEGVGDHGCEYMTGGRAVILGSTGRNFAAGMSGGLAYVLDAEGHFPDRLNAEMVNLEHLSNPWDENFLKGMIERHRKLTGSRHALDILTRWDHYRRIFWKVFPNPPEALAFKEHKAEMEETFLVTSGF